MASNEKAPTTKADPIEPTLAPDAAPSQPPPAAAPAPPAAIVAPAPKAKAPAKPVAPTHHTRCTVVGSDVVSMSRTFRVGDVANFPNSDVASLPDFLIPVAE